MRGKEAFGITLVDNAIGSTSAAVAAGSTLTGSVWLHIDKDCKAGGITLVFTGTERTLVKYYAENSSNTRSDNTATTTYIATSSRNIVTYRVPLVQQNSIQDNNKIAAGNYEWPFAIELPSILPSSFKEVSADGSYCEICYELCAEIPGSGFFSNYKASHVVPITAVPLQRQPVPYSAPPDIQSVKFCCCWNRGTLAIAAAVSDTKLDKTESVTVQLALSNQSTMVRIQRVQAQLVQTIQWQAEMRHKQQTRKIVSNAELNANEVMQINNNAISSSKYYTTPTTTSTETALWNELQSSSSPQYSLQLTMPATAHASYSGQLVQISHGIEIHVSTGRCITNPELHIPVECGEQAVTTTTANVTTPVQPIVSANKNNNKTDMVLGGKPADSATVQQSPEKTTVQATTTQEASLTMLLKLMDESALDVAIVESKLQDPTWTTNFFTNLSPTDYGAILRGVRSDFDQTSVAQMVAVRGVASNFTCGHVVAALQAVAAWNRGAIVAQLLPNVADLQAHQGIIREELSDWELMVAETAFADALAQTQSS